MVEALGIALPTNAAIPAVDSRRYALAHQAGRRSVEIVRERTEPFQNSNKRGIRKTLSE